MLPGPKTVRIYSTDSGKAPFEEWVNHLKDRGGQAAIRSRVDRLELGNAGKCEPVGDGVYELKIYYGPGYRVYFGEHGAQLIILLCGGDKRSQSKDIQKAKAYWAHFKRKNEKHKELPRQFN